MNTQGEDSHEDEPVAEVKESLPTSSFVRWFGPVRVESQQKFRWYGPVRVAEKNRVVS